MMGRMRLMPTAVLLASLLSVLPLAAAPARVRLAPQGDILAWIVLGPFPNPGTPHESCGGWDRDYLDALGGETRASLADGQTAAAPGGPERRARLALADARSGLNLAAAVGSRDQGVAYASATVESESAVQARLLLGSDDGVKVWVNGELVHSKHLRRGVNRDEDSVAVRLRKGENRLLFKVCQGEGEWGLVARLTAADGSRLEGAAVVVDVEQTGREKEPPADAWVRKAAGKPGSLDMLSARGYLDWNEKAARWLKGFRADASEPERLEALLNSLPARIAEAEKKDADALSDALARSASAMEEQYTRSRAPFLAKAQNPAPLFGVSPLNEDFVTVMPGGRYFAHADGKPFIPLGYNHNPDWDMLIQANPLHPAYDPAVTGRFFQRLKRSGVNLVRLMLETPSSGLMEDPLGVFSPEHMRWIDNVVIAARKADVKLLITPWDTFWMNYQWDIVRYNAANGGPVVRKVDFLTKPEVMEAQKKRLRYIVDRWGNTGTVFGWDVLNEADLWWEASPQQVRRWAREMMHYIRDYETRKWGRAHLVTTSIANAMPGGVLGDLAYRDRESDFANTHLYIGVAKAPTEPVGPALAELEGVTFALDAINDRRPYLDSESGPIDRWIADGKLDDEVFHNTSWAHLASGGAGSGLRWPYRGPHYLSDGMLESLRLMSGFTARVPWKDMPWAKGQMPSVQAPEGWAAMMCGNSKAAILWVLSKSGQGGGVTLSITWPSGAAKLRCRPYDTHMGKWLNAVDAPVSGGKASLTLKGLPKSTALIITPL